MANNKNNKNNNCNNSQQYKKSGVKYTKIKTGNFKGLLFVSAWRKIKDCLITATCFPRLLKNGDLQCYNGDNTEYIRYRVDLKKSNDIKVETYYCFMNVETQKIFIKELGWIISPNGSGVIRSGKTVTGYFGIVKK